MIGSSFPYMEFLPKPGQARGDQLDLDPTRIGLRYPMEVGLVGDSKRTLHQLLPLLRSKEDRKFIHKIQKSLKNWWELMEERGTRKDKPMKPQVVAWEIGKHLRDDAVVSCDIGTIATWFARQMKVRRGQDLLALGNARDDGQWFAVLHRFSDRLFEASMRRVRW